ncbi:hypothetical protein V8G54_011862 [Vigna mungo]|uniref:Uncharacterized protein n=1 Tax=Vigna mungo TaxID=3915 RepID=A0AAQ3S3A2_VIGMU
MLEMTPDLLFETTQAYIDDDVCCAATSFLKCFLECLRDEFWESDGIEGGYALYRGHCLPPVLYGLGSGSSKLRTNINTYALPFHLGWAKWGGEQTTIYRACLLGHGSESRTENCYSSFIAEGISVTCFG